MLAAQIPKEAFVKAHALVTANRLNGTNPHSRVESTGGLTVSYCHGMLSPAWRVFAAGNWKFKGSRSVSALPTFAEDKHNVEAAGWLQVCTYFQDELLG